jgi:hypothetical protein
MANLHRGEIEAEIGGRKHRLCLTLGALAELEQRFGESDLVGFARRIEQGRLSARDLIAIIGCGLRGAGAELSDEEVAAMRSADGLAGYVAVAARLLAATFGGGEPAGSASLFPPQPQSA